jgi:hypothetical protein
MPFIRIVRDCRLVFCRFVHYEEPEPGEATHPPGPSEAPFAFPETTSGYDYCWAQSVRVGEIYEVGEFAEGEEGKTCLEFIALDAYAEVPNACWAWHEAVRYTFEPGRESPN